MPTNVPDHRTLEWVPLGTLAENVRNPKAHDTELIDASVTRFGFVEPIVVDGRTGQIISGHGRTKTLRAMHSRGDVPPEGIRTTDAGEWLVPVATGWASANDSEANAALIALNRATEVGGWVDEELLGILSELSDYTGVGFDDHDIDDLDSAVAAANAADGNDDRDPDDVPSVRLQPRSRLGQVWDLGRHRVVCGDSTDPGTYAALLDGDPTQPRIMWTDPPYGVDYVGKTKDALTIKNDGAATLADLLTPAFKAAAAVLHPGSPVYVMTAQGPDQLTSWTALDDAGVSVRQMLLWVKNTMILGRSDYHYKHEPILYGFTRANKGQGRLGRGGARWFGTNSETTVNAVDVPHAFGRMEVTLADVLAAALGTGPELEVDPRDVVEGLLGGMASVFEVHKPAASRLHPTTKPTELIRMHLTNSARARDVVLDPFGGSGSTLIAADQLGMDARLIELDPQYVDVIVDRWEGYTGEKAVLRG